MTDETFELGDILLEIAAAGLGLGALCRRCQHRWREHTQDGCPTERQGGTR